MCLLLAVSHQKLTVGLWSVSSRRCVFSWWALRFQLFLLLLIHKGKKEMLRGYWLTEKANAGTRTDLDTAWSHQSQMWHQTFLVKLSGFKQDNIDTMKVMGIDYFYYCPCLQDNIPNLCKSTEYGEVTFKIVTLLIRRKQYYFCRAQPWLITLPAFVFLKKYPTVCDKDNGFMPQFLTKRSLFQGHGKGWWQESSGPFAREVSVEGVCAADDYQVITTGRQKPARTLTCCIQIGKLLA